MKRDCENYLSIGHILDAVKRVRRIAKAGENTCQNALRNRSPQGSRQLPLAFERVSKGKPGGMAQV